MRIYTRHSDPSLAVGVVRHLLAVLDSDPSEVWLISPWLRDVELPVADVGHFASVFGSHRDQVLLSELLVRTAQVHELHLITKPLAELVPFRVVHRLIKLLRTRDSVVADPELQGYETVDGALAALNDAARSLASEATRHADTIELALHLRGAGCDVLFLDRLHAKFLWSPVGALLGSANFTHGGFAWNEELMVELSSEVEHSELGGVIDRFREWSVASRNYRLQPAFKDAGISADDFLQWPGELEAFGDDRLAGLLARLSEFVA